MKKLVCFALALCLLWGAGCLLPVRAELSEEEKEEILWKNAHGDVNKDTIVNAHDALLILKAAVGKVTLSEEEIVIGDMTNDGVIDAADALHCLISAVHLYPISREQVYFPPEYLIPCTDFDPYEPEP